MKNYKLMRKEQYHERKRAKYRDNVKAIKLIKTLEKEKRMANKDEQEILSYYSGWGGIKEAFEENNRMWINEYEELKKLLTEEEYINAKESTKSAFFTSPEIIKGIWEMLGNMELKEGVCLEPSCGTGNFFASMPEHLKLNMTGVEIDEITSKMAKHLYPENRIINGGYEKIRVENNTFDLIISNIPFGDFKITDKEYENSDFFIHDYFMQKSIDKLKKSGVIAFITSIGMLDKKDETLRRYMAQKSDLIGAFRVCKEAFKKTSSAFVTSDIILLQKREIERTREEIEKVEWVKTLRGNETPRLNKYFVNHPEMILGEMKIVNGKWRPRYSVQLKESQTLEGEMKRAVSLIKDKEIKVGHWVENKCEKEKKYGNMKIKNLNEIKEKEMYEFNLEDIEF